MNEGGIGKIRVRRELATGLLALLFAIGVTKVGATPMLDQEYFDITNVLLLGSEPDNNTDTNFRRAQTFTVGLAGVLDHVDMRGIAGSSMRILSTTGGVPTFNVLASTDSFTRSNGWIRWDLSSSGLSVTPGEVLAMDMLGGRWDGHGPAGYVRGADYFRNVFAGFPTFTLNRSSESFIRTFVNVPQPVPEPVASLPLLALGLTGLGIFFSLERWAKLR